MFLQVIGGMRSIVRAAMLRCYGDRLRYADAVALVDGSVQVVPRADLAAAKAMLAAQKVAERRAVAGLVVRRRTRLLEKAV